MTFARVVLPVSRDSYFDYSIPERFVSSVKPGVRVLVPWGKELRTGLVVALAEATDAPYTRDIVKPIDKEPFISEGMCRLLVAMSNFYVTPPGVVLNTILPPPVRSSRGHRSDQNISLTSPDVEVRGPLQKKVVDFLKSNGEATMRVLVARTGCKPSAVKAMLKKGILAVRHTRARQNIFEYASPEMPPDIVLNDDQKYALEEIIRSIDGTPPPVTLVYGVTGSGKTEVYINAMKHAIRKGGQAMVLLPEISLTPQVISRFASHFSDISILHSSITEGERTVEFERIRKGKVQVVIGVRSAVFAPFPKLKLIVIDEEHSASYTNSEQPTYNVRDVALYRSKFEGCAVVLGSATPSIESYYRAKSGEFRLVRLPNRVKSLPMPEIIVVDMRAEHAETGKFFSISRTLMGEIRGALSRKEQILLLLNRKGFATLIRCSSCKNLLQCQRCSVSMTFHKDENLCKCHYCLKEMPVPPLCPTCGKSKLSKIGLGTEKVVETLKMLVPEAKIERMDAETMQTADDYRRMLDAIRYGKVDIVVGTQMISKGLDFPNVTLVGIVSADVGTYHPSYKSGERRFQLITQVAGRAGRSERRGKVVVQTREPNHPSIQYATNYDYEGFYASEIESRAEVQYPPWTLIYRIVVESKDRELAKKRMLEISNAIRQKIPDGQFSGPSNCFIYKWKNWYREHFQIRCGLERASEHGNAIRAAIYGASEGEKLPLKVKIQVLPEEML